MTEVDGITVFLRAGRREAHPNRSLPPITIDVDCQSWQNLSKLAGLVTFDDFGKPGGVNGMR